MNMIKLYPISYLIILVIFIIIAVYGFFCRKRTAFIIKELADAKDQLKYTYKLFDKHFKIADHTIIDLRKERDELKRKLKKLH